MLPLGLKSPLTERARQILALAAEGLRQKDIGYKLGISLSTVKTHLQQFHIKHGTSNIIEAVAMALRNGWIV